MDDPILGPDRRRWLLAVASAVALVVAIVIGVVVLHGRTPDASTHRLGGGASPLAGAEASLAPSQAKALATHVSCSGRPESRVTAASRTEVARFHTVVAVLCSVASRTYSDGVWLVELRRVGTRGITPLLAALNRPDDHPTSGACASYLDIDPALYLVNAAGRVIHPRYPRDGCGHLQPAPLTATNRIGWRTVSLTKLQLDIPKDPVARACGTAWKNMITVEGAHAPASSGGPILVRDADDPLIVCRYHVTTDPVVGRYVRGTRLSADDSATLLNALSKSAPAQRCSAQQDFAVVQGPSGALAYVELGGCWRVLRDDNTFGSANPAVVSGLAAR